MTKRLNISGLRKANPKSLKPHPLAHLIPDMRPSEWQNFYNDIAMRGIKVPLEVLADGTVLDGRHRLRAAIELGMKEVPIVDAPLDGDNPEVYMLKAAVLRRHLNDDQRAIMAARWKEENKAPTGAAAHLQRRSNDTSPKWEHRCSHLGKCEPKPFHYLINLQPTQAEECIRTIFRATPCKPLDGKRGKEGLEVRWGAIKTVSRREIVVFRDELKQCQCSSGVIVSLGGFQKGAIKEATKLGRPKLRLITATDILAEAERRRVYLYVENNSLVVVPGEVTEEEAARLFRVPRHKIDRATYVQKHNPELATKVHKGDIALSNAYRQAKAPEERQKIEATKPPEGTYQVLVIDPSWPFSSRREDPTRQGMIPYEPMSIEAIKALKIPAADNSVLWLWVPNAFLHDAFHVLGDWGFTYHTTLTWAKNFVGLGDWLGGQTEQCLLATKGNYRIFRKNESTLLTAPKTKHSEKPDAFYELVERLCPGTKIDMFARRKRQGWSYWGAEVNE